MSRSKYTPFIAAAIAFMLIIIITIVIEKFRYSTSLRYIMDIVIGIVTLGTYFFVWYQSRNSPTSK